MNSLNNAKKCPACEKGLDTDKAPPCLFVLFGATGDLAARKIAPALYNLYLDGRLDERFGVVGVSRRDWSDETFQQAMGEAIANYSRRPLDPAVWERFSRRWHYQKVEATRQEDYEALTDRMRELDAQYGTACSRVVYVAMSPEFFKPVTEFFGKARFHRPICDGGFSRLVIEKPFGQDLATAEELNQHLIQQGYDESQIYRIDHYLGKETVQNILAFRFANAMFDPHLNYQWVDNVQITTAETVGMEGRRGNYYEHAGALRDMIQNHMLQLLAFVAMDRPDCLRCENLRDAKVQLLESIKPLTPEQVRQWTVRAQYTGDDDGPAYCEEAGVAPDSDTETFAAVKLYIDNLRWQGVPFYLRTGKRLARKTSQIIVTFKREPFDLYRAEDCDFRSPNRLTIRITPDEGISLHFDAKVPGASHLLRPVSMDFSYEAAFASATPEAYEHLICDAMSGDSAMFIRGDEVSASWRIVDSIRRVWQAGGDRGMLRYAPGSWGPIEANEIFEDPYVRWHVLDK